MVKEMKLTVKSEILPKPRATVEGRRGMKIAIVIVKYGPANNLEECRESLRASILHGIECKQFVIDNNKKNLGFSGGNNVGIEQALKWGADAILLLNDDTKVDKLAIKHLSTALFSSSGIGITVPKIYFYPGYEYHKNRYSSAERGKVIWYAGGTVDWQNVYGKHVGVDEVDRGQYDRAGETGFASGCCALVKKEVFEQAGLFDERYFLYLEDMDFSVRAKKAGFNILYEPKAVVWHKNAQSSGVGEGLHDYFFTRNRLLFGAAYTSLRTRFALARESMRILLKGNNWKRRGVLDFYFGRFGKGNWKS